MWHFDFFPPTNIPTTARWLQFRKRHLQALAGLFTQALELCQKAGLVRLGHVAIDGTKLQVNASKHKAMRYGRMGEVEKRTGKKVGGREPKAPDPETATPEANAQRNFTDPQSRIMPSDSQTCAFVQGYNAQLAVDGVAQVSAIFVAWARQRSRRVEAGVPDPQSAEAVPVRLRA